MGRTLNDLFPLILITPDIDRYKVLHIGDTKLWKVIFMLSYDYWSSDLNTTEDTLSHHGILGMKWGQRRYQYIDGSLTPEGRRRYLKSDGSLTRAGKQELARRNTILDYERGRRVIEAENAAARGDYDTVSRIKSISPATSLDDVSFRQFEKDYNAAKFWLDLRGVENSDLITMTLANDRFTKAVGKYADPDDAIQDYIGWKGYSATVKEDKLAPFK